GEGNASFDVRRTLEQGAGFGLKDRDEIDGVDVALVLTAFRFRQFALIALSSKMVDLGLCSRIKTESDEFARDLRREDFSHWVVQSIQNGCVGILHAPSIQWQALDCQPLRLGE